MRLFLLVIVSQGTARGVPCVFFMACNVQCRSLNKMDIFQHKRYTPTPILFGPYSTAWKENVGFWLVLRLNGPSGFEVITGPDEPAFETSRGGEPISN